MKPYVFVADDIQKDNSPHVYKWLLQIPKDLTLKTGVALPAAFKTNTDCILAEPATNGNRSLLVRVMSPTNWAAYTETVSNVTYNSEQFYRLVVITTNVAPAKNAESSDQNNHELLIAALMARWGRRADCPGNGSPALSRG